MIANRTVVNLDGASLTTADLHLISQRKCDTVIPQAVYDSVEQANVTLDQRLANGDIVYGVNTGFGENSTTIISNNDLQELQLNLLRSHACGVGEMVSHPIVRKMIALRINSLVRGHSGVTTQTLHTLHDALTKDCLPPVPSQGSVGASGDLCPLAHLVLPFTGTPNLQLWNPVNESYEPAEQVMHEFKIRPLDLKRKEGLALINGTQFMTSNATEALFIAKNAWRHSILAASLSCAALQAVPAAFDPRIHNLRPHQGQIKTAEAVRNIVFTESTPSFNTDIQDPYSIRCIPQILGPFVEISTFVEKLLSTEINSVTDNPLIFSEDQKVLSGGNFHGQYPAKASDMLAMVIPDMCNVAERRIARLVDHSLSNLPAFLIPKEKCGLHSGMMIPAYTAAALCSENKCLSHPSSVDTIPTCANKEDHVSMGAYAARKAIKAATNAEVVIAIELLVAAQALDLLMITKQVQPSGPVKRIHEVVRESVKFMDGDRYLKADIDAVVNLVRSGRLTNGFDFPI